MAYANLVSQACASNAEVFMRLRDFLCKRNGTYDYSTTGIGWTLHDAVYATDQSNVAFNDYFVAYSPGEDGNQDIYVKVTYIAGNINIHTYLYWNATTHTGVTAANTSNNWTNTNSTAATLWIYGDLDSFVVISKYSTNYYSSFGGHCVGTAGSSTVATSSSSVPAGSSRVVTVNAVPSGWVTGRKIYIRDTANIEIVTISNIAGNDVTLATVVASYLANCKLQGDVTYMCQTSTAAFGGAAFVLPHSGSKGATVSREAFSVAPAGYADSLLPSSPYPMVPIFFGGANNFIGPVKNVYLVNTTSLTNESTHTYSGTSYRFFTVGALSYLIKEV